MNFRKADKYDIVEIAEIYDLVHEEEEKGKLTIGWAKGVYPTEQDAINAVERGDMFVFDTEGCVAACAIINRLQVDVYAEGNWQYPAGDDEVMVLHTLCVDPRCMRQGYGKLFVEFYEFYAAEQGCKYLRMDTNANNILARNMYRKLGYKEVGIVPCTFNSIGGVELVLLEKKLD